MPPSSAHERLRRHLDSMTLDELQRTIAIWLNSNRGPLDAACDCGRRISSKQRRCAHCVIAYWRARDRNRRRNNRARRAKEAA